MTRTWRWCERCELHIDTNTHHEHESKPMGRPAIQSEIPGFEDPDRDENLDAVLYAWIEAKEEQRRAADTAKIRHATLLAELADRGLERYPYSDRTTGKKRFVVADKTPRAKIVKPPGGGGKRKKAKEGAVTVKGPGLIDEAIARQADEDTTDGKVEYRRVSRESVENEIGPLDPFASTRAAMEDDENPTKPDKAAKPKKRKGKAKN